MADDGGQATHAYYDRGEEQDRLSRPLGIVEFERTKEIVSRHLVPPPAIVADIGGGPGRYALWLAWLGYRVVHRDLVPLHVDQLAKSVGESTMIDSAVGDARHLNLYDASVDAVLLLGPLYHLERRRDRVQALREACRIVRPGGPVFVAAISRWTPRLDGILRLRLYETVPDADTRVRELERTGRMPPLSPSGFGGYCHRPAQLRAEVTSAGLEPIDLLGVEGPTYLLADLAERMADGKGREAVLDTARAVERVPELLGASSHLLVVAKRPSVNTG